MEELPDERLMELFSARGELQQELFAQARAVRREQGLDPVCMRGVIELSNICQKRCSYCAMACSNQTLDRYRLEPARIMEIAGQMPLNCAP